MLTLPHAWPRRLSVAVRVGAFSASVTVVGRGGEAADELAPPETPVASSAVGTHAEPERHVILLVRTPGDDETISRLRPELSEGGWHILELRPDDRLEAEALGITAEREGVAAAVRIDVAHSSIELWVYRAEGSIVETFTASRERSSGRVLAVRVAEALRARGLLLPPRPEQHVDEPAPDPVTAHRYTQVRLDEPPATDATVAHALRFSVELGAGLALSPGGLAPLAVVDLGLRLELARVWSLSAIGVLPVSRQVVRGTEGEAVVASYVVGGLVELEWATFRFGGLRSGLGVGATITAMSGRASSGFEGQDDTVSVLTPLGRTSFHANLGSWLRLRTAVAIGATLPPVRIDFDAREAASWGNPFVIASVALEASSP
jgi:hypothetical protein